MVLSLGCCYKTVDLMTVFGPHDLPKTNLFLAKAVPVSRRLFFYWTAY
jgi:hypothetical protein